MIRVELLLKSGLTRHFRTDLGGGKTPSEQAELLTESMFRSDGPIWLS